MVHENLGMDRIREVHVVSLAELIHRVCHAMHCGGPVWFYDSCNFEEMSLLAESGTVYPYSFPAPIHGAVPFQDDGGLNTRRRNL